MAIQFMQPSRPNNFVNNPLPPFGTAIGTSIPIERCAALPYARAAALFGLLGVSPDL